MDFLTFGLNITDDILEIAKDVLQSDDNTLIKTGITRIAQEFENYDNFCLAGRLLIYQIVKTIPTIEVYIRMNKNMLSEHIVDYFLANAGVLNNAIREADHFNYYNQDYFSASTMSSSYMLKPIVTKDPAETPVLHNLRIAVQLYYDVSIDRVLKAFNEMNMCYYTHASPTKYNAGTKRPQMASCFLMGVDDDLSSMMYTGVGDLGMISSSNGGIGIGFNNVRHSDIAGTGDSAGVIPYARVCDKAIGYVDQSRKRRGAATGYLNVWHIDIMDFIQAASTYIPQDLRLIDLTPCIWMHDLFKERCDKNDSWTLFCPHTVPDLVDKYGDQFDEAYLRYEALASIRENAYLEADREYDRIRSVVAKSDDTSESLLNEFTEAAKKLAKAKKEKIVYKKVKAREIMRLISDIQGKSGKPYVMNGDSCNYKSNHQNIGPIRNSNLCVEIVQYSDANTFSACTLASMNLTAYASGPLQGTGGDIHIAPDEEIMTALAKVYDFKTLGEMTKSVVRNLDEVVEKNFYPLDKSKIRDFTMDTRSLGIGVSGLDDAFKVLDLVYGSRESLILNKMIFACMYYNALEASCELAQAHGPYPLFRTGKFRFYDKNQGKFVELQGSPMSNGLLQFDLWDSEYHKDALLGRNHSMYDPEDNTPVDPKYFGIDSTWESLKAKIVEHGVRNSLLLAIMPTASTAQVMRNAESTEAHQSNMYVREVRGGSFPIVNRHLVKDLKDIGLFNPSVMKFIYNEQGCLDDFVAYVKGLSKEALSKEGLSKEALLPRVEYLVEKYKTMFDIKPSTFLKMARQRGIYIDQSQSTNIYLRDPTDAQLSAVQMVAFHNKLKTHSYYIRQAVKTSNTGFNKKVTDSKTFGVDNPPSCSIDESEGCEMCGS